MKSEKIIKIIDLIEQGKSEAALSLLRAELEIKILKELNASTKSKRLTALKSLFNDKAMKSRNNLKGCGETSGYQTLTNSFTMYFLKGELSFNGIEKKDNFPNCEPFLKIADYDYGNYSFDYKQLLELMARAKGQGFEFVIFKHSDFNGIVDPFFENRYFALGIKELKRFLEIMDINGNFVLRVNGDKFCDICKVGGYEYSASFFSIRNKESIGIILPCRILDINVLRDYYKKIDIQEYNRITPEYLRE